MSGKLPTFENLRNRKRSFTERFTQRVASTWGRMSTRPETPAEADESDLLTSIIAGDDDPFRLSPKVPRKKKFSSESTATIIPYRRKGKTAFPQGNGSPGKLSTLPAGFSRDAKGNIKNYSRAAIPEEWLGDSDVPPVPAIPKRFATQRFRPAVGPSGTSRTTEASSSKAPFARPEAPKLEDSAVASSDEDGEEALRLPADHRRTLKAGSTPGVSKHAQAVVNKPYIYRSARQAIPKERLPVPDFDGEVASHGAEEGQSSRVASQSSLVSEGRSSILDKTDALDDLRKATEPSASADGNSVESVSQNSNLSVKKTGFIDKPTVIKSDNRRHTSQEPVVFCDTQEEGTNSKSPAGPSIEKNSEAVPPTPLKPRSAASIVSSSSSRTPLGIALQFPHHVVDALGKECMWMSEPTGGYWRVTPKGMQKLDEVLAAQRHPADVSSDSNYDQPEESGVIDPTVVEGVVREAERNTALV